jgi:uncharacterized protein (TIGR03083 family)
VAALDGIRELTAAQITLVSDVVARLSDADLVVPTGCAGWQVAHLLVHLRLDAAELLAGFADPAYSAPDRDFVSYWRDWPAAAEPVTFGRVRWMWASASAYARGDDLRRHFTDAAAAAAAASRNAPTGRFRFQGHILEADDLLAMWTVEFALHQLDLIAELPGHPGPLPEAVSLVVATLDGLVGSRRPSSWDEVTYALKGTGRVPLDAADTEFLGEQAAAYPAFG